MLELIKGAILEPNYYDDDGNPINENGNIIDDKLKVRHEYLNNKAKDLIKLSLYNNRTNIESNIK